MILHPQTQVLLHFKLRKKSSTNAAFVLKSRAQVTTNGKNFFSNYVTVYGKQKIYKYRDYGCTTPYWRTQ